MPQTKKDNENLAKEKKVKKENESISDGIDKDEMTKEDYVEYLETELGKNIAALNEQKSSFQRLMADFENYKKRNAKIAEENRDYATCALLEDILPVLDNLDRAKAMISDKSVLSGFELIEEDLKRILSEYDVVEIEADGKDFDANLMNAVMSEPNEELKGKVLMVFSKGYMRGKKVIRYAQVKIAI